MAYPPEIKSQALALVIQGYSSLRIASELATLYPNDAPSSASIRVWRQEYLAETGTELDPAIMANARDIALRAQRHILDILEDSTFTKGDLSNLNVTSGVAIDKIQRSQQHNQQPNILIAIQARAQELEAKAIEGDYKLLDDPE